MEKSISSAIVGLVILVFTGCTSVKFYSNPDLVQKSGLKFYTAKPYLQLEKDASNNTIVKATVIYLPDLTNPQYMVIKDGMGSRKIDLKLNDGGTINSLGVTTDPKIAETVEALAALISKGSAALEDLASLKRPYPPAASSTVIELYEVLMTSEGTTLRKVEFK